MKIALSAVILYRGVVSELLTLIWAVVTLLLCASMAIRLVRYGMVPPFVKTLPRAQVILFGVLSLLTGAGMVRGIWLVAKNVEESALLFIAGLVLALMLILFGLYLLMRGTGKRNNGGWRG